LNNVSSPYMGLIKNDVDVYLSLVNNLFNRLVPSINRIDKIESKQVSEIVEALRKLLDFAIAPKLEKLESANMAFLSLPLPEKIGKFGIVKTTFVKNRTLIQHSIVVALAIASPYAVYQFDIGLGAQPHDAFVPAFSAIVFVIMAYIGLLNLTKKNQKA
jgi:hypothetical protein